MLGFGCKQEKAALANLSRKGNLLKRYWASHGIFGRLCIQVYTHIGVGSKLACAIPGCSHRNFPFTPPILDTAHCQRYCICVSKQLPENILLGSFLTQLFSFQDLGHVPWLICAVLAAEKAQEVHFRYFSACRVEAWLCLTKLRGFPCHRFIWWKE